MQMREVLLIHISSIGCCNPLVTMLNNGNCGFPYSLLPRFLPLQSGAAFSTPAFTVAPPEAVVILIADQSYADDRFWRRNIRIEDYYSYYIRLVLRYKRISWSDVNEQYKD